jgi:hypothetical protein
MVGGVGLFVLVVLAGVMAASNPGGKVDDKAPVVVMLGLGIIGGVLFAVVGAGLGIAGIVQKNRKKLFATLGLIFNALAVLGVVGLMIIGLAAK